VFGPSFIRNQWQKQNSSRVIHEPYATVEDEAKVKTLPHVRWCFICDQVSHFVRTFPDFGGDSTIFVQALITPE